MNTILLTFILIASVVNGVDIYPHWVQNSVLCSDWQNYYTNCQTLMANCQDYTCGTNTSVRYTNPWLKGTATVIGDAIYDLDNNYFLNGCSTSSTCSCHIFENTINTPATACSNCKSCTNGTNCTNCSSCSDTSNCTKCSSCTHCTSSGCTGCSGCVNCANCIGTSCPSTLNINQCVFWFLDYLYYQNNVLCASETSSLMPCCQNALTYRWGSDMQAYTEGGDLTWGWPMSYNGNAWGTDLLNDIGCQMGCTGLASGANAVCPD